MPRKNPEARAQYNHDRYLAHREERRLQQRVYRAAHRDEARIRRRAWEERHPGQVRKRHFVRLAYIDSLKTGGCVDCGNKNLTVLDFDHIRGIKVKGLGAMTGSTFAKIDTEVAKCEVVCSNCHRIRTYARLAPIRARKSSVTV